MESEDLSDNEEKLQEALKDEEISSTVNSVTKLMKQHTRAAKKGDNVDKQLGAMF